MCNEICIGLLQVLGWVVLGGGSLVLFVEWLFKVEP